MYRTIILLILSTNLLFSQNEDSLKINEIYNEALTDYTAYNQLKYLCKNIGGRISGTPQAAAAVNYTFHIMKSMELDTVYLQEVVVPHWERGEEFASVISEKTGYKELKVSALGMSVGTGEKGLSAKVIEISSFEDLRKKGKKNIEGKIVFFNTPMPQEYINTFRSYGSTAKFRTTGASEAAKYGAVGVIVRSLTGSVDDHPHTGVMYYQNDVMKIPAVMVSTIGANLLSERLKLDPDCQLYIKSTCKIHPNTISYNVIGQITGTEFPDEIITIGGHLDSWDTGEGAHDDGVGCIQSIEVLRIFKKLGIKPKRTIRAVMFMDEEIAQTGGKAYAKQAKIKIEKHYFALESDRGGTTPYGISIDTRSFNSEKIRKWYSLLKPYGIYVIQNRGGGVDISFLKKEFNTPLGSILVDPQRYFTWHHSTNDLFKYIDRREMQLGSALMASLIVLIDTYGIE